MAGVACRCGGAERSAHERGRRGTDSLAASLPQDDPVAWPRHPPHFFMLIVVGSFDALSITEA
jgi:hypothetical protein